MAFNILRVFQLEEIYVYLSLLVVFDVDTTDSDIELTFLDLFNDHGLSKVLHCLLIPPQLEVTYTSIEYTLKTLLVKILNQIE